MENDDINIFGKELNQKDIEEENDLDISNNKGLIIDNPIQFCIIAIDII